MSENNKNIIVIGAGIVGVSTAIWLQRTGFNVTLMDRKGVAAETSYGNAGLLAACAIIPVTTPDLMAKAPKMLLSNKEPLFLRWSYLPKLIPFLMKYIGNANQKDMERISSGLYDLMHDSPDQHLALAKGTPAEKYIKPGEYLFCYPNKSYFEKDLEGWKLRRKVGLLDEEMDADALAAFDPALKGKFGYAVKALNQGRITDPGEYMKALGEHFVDEGGTLVLEEVEDIPLENGRAIGVKTKSGIIEADEVVVCAGAWSTPLMKKLGVKIPLEAERGYHLEFTNANVELTQPVMVAAKKFVMHSMDGRLRCAGIVEFAGLDSAPSRAPLELIMKNIKEIFPDLKYDEIREWYGERPSTPDSLPLIGAFKDIPNLWAGCGHQHLGLTGGPKTGRWLSRLIAGEKMNIDLTPYEADRFS